MNEMLKLLLKSNGLSFVYSSFKILEGLDIFSKVLEANGYQEFDLKIKIKVLIYQSLLFILVQKI